MEEKEVVREVVKEVEVVIMTAIKSHSMMVTEEGTISIMELTLNYAIPLKSK